MKKTISILGSTGSVGLSTLNIINKKRNFFTINLLSSNGNFKHICSQIKKYKPKFFIINNKNIFEKIKRKFRSNKTIILNDYKKVNIKKKNDISICAIPGISGLEPTIKMITKSKKVLIANKESIVCGWELIKKNANKNKTKIIPIDSEHFSILKLLENHKMSEIKKIFITASGGPFLNYKANQFKNITPNKAIKHPKWKMGKKISVDSSTMMNKILEIIEAQKLFNIPDHKIDIIIHPESLVHAIIELNNGLLKFIYHETTMTIPLVNAIFDNEIDINEFIINKKSDNNLRNLTFQKINKKVFPIINLRKKANQHPSSSIIMNASNEVLVNQFLLKKIPFLAIYKIIKTIMNDRNYTKYAIKRPKNIRQIYLIDFWAGNKTLEKIKLYNV